jgi:rare lipoprotein A
MPTMNAHNLLLLIITLIILSSCGGSKDRLHKTLSKEDSSHINYTGHYKVGTEYKVKNKTYKPTKNKNYNEIGIASWYGPGFHGKKTANGEKYNKSCLSAAHKSLPMPSLVKVTNLKNKKSLIVLVNDRGPFAKNRIIDVSEKAASILGFKKSGTAKVKVEYLANDTNKFLYDIGLKPKAGSKTKHKKPNTKCSINCHVKLVNMKHKLAI